MGNVLVIAEHKDGVVKKVSRAAITFAKEYTGKKGGEVHVLVMGSGIGAVAEECTGYGAAKVHVAD